MLLFRIVGCIKINGFGWFFVFREICFRGKDF